MAKNIAEAEQIPGHFLAKILQQLARRGYLRSSKGPTGGFSLKKAPEKISLFEIALAVDGPNDYERCICGAPECNGSTPCGLTDSWTRMRSAIIKYLEGTSVRDVARSLEQKRLALGKQRKTRRPPAKRG